MLVPREEEVMMTNGDLLSKVDSAFLLELIHSSLFCTSEESLRELVGGLEHLLPHHFALCALGRIDRSDKEPPTIINVSYPSEWLRLYGMKRFDRIDPIVRENCRNSGIKYWRDIYDRYDDCGSFVSYARDFGLMEGYCHGMRTFSGHKASLFSFAGPAMERNRRTELILEYIVPHLHQAFTRVCDAGKEKKNASGPPLSSREKEVLKWAKDGKSSWEISVILSISKDTVKFHIKNIMEKLQAVSRTQAVAIAMESGLIHID
jgi:DNA-binding CsgD family transcriptional regulator